MLVTVQAGECYVVVLLLSHHGKHTKRRQCHLVFYTGFSFASGSKKIEKRCNVSFPRSHPQNIIDCLRYQGEQRLKISRKSIYKFYPEKIQTSRQKEIRSQGNVHLEKDGET